MNSGSKVAIVAITENGKQLAIKIKELLSNGDIYVSSKIHAKNLGVIDKSMKDFVGNLFNQYDYLIFIMATGIVVRSIAPFIESKLKDPAILVIDEKGKNVISLLSGHVGGANEMTLNISNIINSNPVITTATDVNEKSSLDMIAKNLNAYIADFRDRVKEINYELIHNKKVGIYIDGNYKVDTRGFEVIENLNSVNKLEKLIYISNKKYMDFRNKKIIKVTPRDIVIGIGCRRNTDFKHLYDSLMDFLDRYNIDEKSIKCIGSVEVKKDEKAILDLSKKLDVPFEIISIENIKQIEDKFDKSEFVKKNIGVYCVAEPVAYVLSNSNLIIEKHKYKGITFSVGRVEI